MQQKSPRNGDYHFENLHHFRCCFRALKRTNYGTRTCTKAAPSLHRAPKCHHMHHLLVHLTPEQAVFWTHLVRGFDKSGAFGADGALKIAKAIAFSCTRFDAKVGTRFGAGFGASFQYIFPTHFQLLMLIGCRTHRDRDTSIGDYPLLF